MTATAVVVTYRSEATIAECVASALAAGVESVVVWDNSDDRGTRRVLEESSGDRVVVLGDGQNHGFGGGVNRALPSVGTENVLLLNPDCVVASDTVAKLEAALEGPGIGIVAPRMLYPNGQPGIAGGPVPSILKEALAALRLDALTPPGMRRALLRAFGKGRHGAGYGDTLVPGSQIEVEWVSGFCLMAPTALLRDLGGFDEEFFLYFEDVDLCVRAARAGARVVLVREATALHHESTSMGEDKSRHYRAGFGVFLRKHRSRGALRLARLLGVAA